MSFSADQISSINAHNFENIALQIFRKQYQENPVYNAYCNALNARPEIISSLVEIPFLPVSFFKSHTVICGAAIPHLYFESSGTTSEKTASRHYIPDEDVYKKSLLQGFKEFYGSPEDYVFLALLPSYLERKNASLVYMAELLMQESGHAANGFYLDNHTQLANTILGLENNSQKTILLGVTFALLDFAKEYPMALKHTLVMETGGMKGRKKEMTRTEVHDFLKQQWHLPAIHSEYGMTELLSQAYAKSGGIFHPARTMKIVIREMNDPLEILNEGVGYVNVIDFANINSCSFIATDDIGKLYPDGSFEILGRADHSALRGCSLMTA